MIVKFFKYIGKFFKKEKHPIDSLLEKLSKLDEDNCEHWIQFCRIYSELANGYGIIYHYKKDRFGNLIHDRYDYEMAEMYDSLNKKFRDKVYSLKTD